jgi:hypothetical protein
LLVFFRGGLPGVSSATASDTDSHTSDTPSVKTSLPFNPILRFGSVGRAVVIVDDVPPRALSRLCPEGAERVDRAVDENLAAFRSDPAALDHRAVAPVPRGASGGEVAAGSGELNHKRLDAGAAGLDLDAVVGLQLEVVGGATSPRCSACSSMTYGGCVPNACASKRSTTRWFQRKFQRCCGSSLNLAASAAAASFSAGVTRR